jgi:hypothetical protein
VVPVAAMAVAVAMSIRATRAMIDREMDLATETIATAERPDRTSPE